MRLTSELLFQHPAIRSIANKTMNISEGLEIVFIRILSIKVRKIIIGVEKHLTIPVLARLSKVDLLTKHN